MAEHSGNSRTSRSRKAIALMAWGCLSFCAFFLWNERTTGNLLKSAHEPVALLLAAFAAFVSVFAWMLFNPKQTTTADSATLFLSAVATLFPPPIIAFNLMPENAPLRWWLAFGVFMLIVIALLSHVPDEFFGVPRRRSSYVVPLPIFDSVADEVMDPQAAWFTFSDLSQLVSDVPRPSLVPRDYLGRDQERSGSPSASQSTKNLSTDGLLNVDAEIGLLDDTLLDYELDADLGGDRSLPPNIPEPAYRSQERSTGRRLPTSMRSASDRSGQSGFLQEHGNQAVRSQQRTIQYPSTNQYSQRLRHEQSSLRTAHTTAGFRRNLRHRLADSVRSREVASSTLADAFEQVDASSKSRLIQQSRPAADSVTTLRSTASQQSERQSPQTQPRTTRPSKTRTSETRPPVTGAATRQAVKAQPPQPEKANQPSHAQQEARTKRKSRREEKRAARRSRSQADRSESLTAGVLPVSLRSTETAADIAKQDTDPLSESIQQMMSQTTSSNSDQRASSTSRVSQTGSSQSNRKTTAQRNRPTKHKSSATDSLGRTETADETRDQRKQKLYAATHQHDDRQQVQRNTDAEGNVVVEGTVPIFFAIGQKKANVHVPFSPPLLSIPQVEVENMGPGDLRLKTPVRQTYGIRIEARRTDDSERLEGELAFAAIAEAHS